MPAALALLQDHDGPPSRLVLHAAHTLLRTADAQHAALLLLAPAVEPAPHWTLNTAFRAAQARLSLLHAELFFLSCHLALTTPMQTLHAHDPHPRTKPLPRPSMNVGYLTKLIFPWIDATAFFSFLLLRIFSNF
jgi:hypothetical protein